MPATGRGFSLVELMISIVILSVILGAMTTFMSKMQQRYTSQSRVAGMSQTGKTIMELLAMDVGQAGFYTGRTTGAPNPITTLGVLNVTLDNAEGIYPGSVIIVDKDTKLEPVRLSAVNHSANQVTGSFKITHTTAPILVRLSDAPYPEGILAPVMKDSTGNFIVNANGSNAVTLKLMGDFRGDANAKLRYVEYRYRAADSSTTACATPPCAVWRSDTCIPGTDVACTNTTQNPAVVVADNVMNDPTTGVFNYTVMCRSGTGTLPTLTYVSYVNSSLAPGTSPCPSTAQFYVIAVGINLTLRTQQSSVAEVGAGGPTILVERQTSFLTRNVNFSLRLAMDGLQELLPEKPPSVPLAP